MKKTVLLVLFTFTVLFFSSFNAFADDNENKGKSLRHHVDLMWVGQQGSSQFQTMPLGYHFSYWNFGPVSVGWAGLSWALNPNVEDSSGLRLMLLPVGFRVHTFDSGPQLYLNGSYTVGKGGDSGLFGMSVSWKNNQ